MKRSLAFLQKFLQRFNEDPRGWGVLLVLLLGLIGERYYHVHMKHHVLVAKVSAEAVRTSEFADGRLAPAGPPEVGSSK